MATARTKVGIIGGLVAAVTLTTALFLTASNEVNIPPGGNLQAAINEGCGKTIVLEAGQAYAFNGTLPNKDCGEQWTTIQSSRVAELPESARVGPEQASLMAKLQSTVNAEPVVRTLPGAHHYKFIGIEFTTRDANVFVYDLVRFGEGRGEQKTVESVPHHLVIDRSYIHGWPTQDSQRGVTVNSAHTDITNSYISEIHGVGFDTQAVAGWNGTNTVRLINNYLEAAGENVMFGGADAAAEALMPINIEIRRNYLFKPFSWKVGHPTYAGKHWTVKNLLELKAAKNVVIDGNVMENNWTDGQAGVAVLFTVRNQECSNPWATVQNVTFSNNTVRGSTGGALNLLGKDNEAEANYEDRPGHVKCSDPGEVFGSVRGSNVTITNSLFHDNGGSFLTLNGFDDVSINRTTHVQRGNFTTIYGQPSQRWKYTNNLTVDHIYGMYIEAGSGVKGLDILTPGWTLQGNVIIDATDPGSWPPGNQLVTGVTLPPDFRSPYPNAGCDIDALNAAQAGGGASQPTPSPSPTGTATPTPPPVSADNSRVPPLSQLVAADSAVWTFNGNLMLRSGADSGGRGSQLLWCGGRVYGLGTDSAWWRWEQGTSWTRVVNDPCAMASPSPSLIPSPTVVPTATPTPTPTPTPQPTPTPAPSPVCMLTVPDSVSIPRSSSLNVTVSLNHTGTITATALSGQVSVSPRSRAVTNTNPSALFQVTVKNNASSVRFDSPCGAKTMQVAVAR